MPHPFSSTLFPNFLCLRNHLRPTDNQNSPVLRLVLVSVAHSSYCELYYPYVIFLGNVMLVPACTAMHNLTLVVYICVYVFVYYMCCMCVALKIIIG